MSNKARKTATKFIAFVLAIVILVGIGVSVQQFALVGDGDTVWIPDYGKVACEPTRLECKPGPCIDGNPSYNDIDQKGTTMLFCGSPTISDANYYEGCNIYLNIAGLFDFTSLKICEQHSNCRKAENTLVSHSTTYDTRKVDLNAGEYLSVSPTLGKYEYRIVAPVYGLSIEGAVKPQYSDRCNIASLLNDKQIATLKGSSDYAKTINAGEINPSNFPVVFIVGYKASYKDQRVIEINGDSWFVEDIGRRCRIEKDTNDRYVVTDDCKNDNSIECFPNIGNCDKNGKLMKSTDPDKKSCEPGTLIGSSTQRIAVNAEKACRLKCNSKGVPVNYDCINIPKCDNGEVLTQDYECVESTKLTEKEKCEANDGRWTETKDSKGNTAYTCDYSKPDYFIFYVIIGALTVILSMILIRMRMDSASKSGKSRRRK